MSKEVKLPYKDFIITEQFICGLTEKGELSFFDKSNGSVIRNEAISNPSIAFLTKDANQNIVIVDRQKYVKKFEDNAWQAIAQSKNAIMGVVFSSQNQCFIITDKGIEDTETHQIYFSERYLNHQLRSKNEWTKPYCLYIDKNDRIWLGFDYGEWGGDILIFSTKDRKFLTPNLGNFKIELWPINSFFEDENSVYLSAALQHMMTSETLIRFDTNLKAITVFENQFLWSESLEDCIGAATYNKSDKSIYFCSQDEIQKGSIAMDLSNKENWKAVLNSGLQWKYGYRKPHKVGSPMNVLKLETIDANRFVFLSQNDGIVYYDGKQLIILR